MITIAVDAMGGDHGIPVVVPAVLQVLKENPHFRLILTGDSALIQNALDSQGAKPSDRLIIRHTTQCVAMDEQPAQALRGKKDSSMRVALNLVKSGEADACVSAGNTGALMATARFVLKTLPGIDRPAIISTFPTVGTGKVRMLDLGANVDSTPQHLLQFAIMGSVLVSALEGFEAPRVALLNIGHEDIKGNELVRESARLFAASSTTNYMNYIGYIEGDQLYSGKVDVVVCDGFVGNVALKTTEGVAIFIRKLLRREFGRNWLSRFAAMLSYPVLRRLAKHIDPDRYNGATFVGLKGVVVKSHGSAGMRAFMRAIQEAAFQAEKKVPERIAQGMATLFGEAGMTGST